MGGAGGGAPSPGEGGPKGEARKKNRLYFFGKPSKGSSKKVLAPDLMSRLIEKKTRRGSAKCLRIIPY